MFGEDSIFTEGRIIGVRSDRAYDAELPNGHRLVAFVIRRDAKQKKTIEIGSRIRLRLSPFDLSKGQVVFDGPEFNDLTKNESKSVSKEIV